MPAFRAWPLTSGIVTLTWLSYLRRYLLFLAAANLLWEALHMPLYTLWQTGTDREILLFGLHCTAGDLLIGSSALLASLMLFGAVDWPRERFRTVALSTISIGLAYTVWSEWYNVYVRESWGYSAWMPVLPVLGIGVSPIAQWIAIPATGFWWTHRSLNAAKPVRP